jgi:hypothetical protein
LHDFWHAFFRESFRMLSMSNLHRPTALPLLELTHKRHCVRIADPRVDPESLGARYVHGGYVLQWLVDGVEVTAQPNPEWNAYEGGGLPEVFEWGLGWGDAAVGDAFMRIGAGRMLKQEGLNESGGPLTQAVEWTVDELRSDAVRMSCSDQVLCGEHRFGYALSRTIEVDDDGVRSSTRLLVDCPWNTPVAWFPHPFFAQQGLDDTALRFPGGHLELGDALLHEDEKGWRFAGKTASKLTRFEPDNGIGFTVAYLKRSQSDRVIEMNCDYPVDHVVVFGTEQAMSVEPQYVRTWPEGMEKEWSVRYRVLDV